MQVLAIEETDLTAEDKQRIRDTPFFSYLGHKDEYYMKEIVDATYEIFTDIYKIKSDEDDAEAKLHPNFVFETEEGHGHSVSPTEWAILKKWMSSVINHPKVS